MDFNIRVFEKFTENIVAIRIEMKLVINLDICHISQSKLVLFTNYSSVLAMNIIQFGENS